MALPQPIKDLGSAALSKVADKFVDFVIIKYTGKSIKTFEAEGDIEADKIRTKWELLEKPFWLQAESLKMGRQYNNLAKTLLKAAPMIAAPVNNIADGNDAFWGLLEHSKEISNEGMQELIAKIIAGEYNAPGTYSMSTLQILKMLGKSELELFERTASLMINDSQIPQDIFSSSESSRELTAKCGVDFGKLQLLQSLGLVLPNAMEKVIQNTLKAKLDILYFDKKISFEPNLTEEAGATEIRLPSYFGLSPVGKQILQHLTPKFNDVYFFWLQNNYKVSGYRLVG